MPTMTNNKPHKGTMSSWRRYRVEGCAGLGYIIMGKFDTHERFAGMRGHTSCVMSHDLDTGEIETLNSRYTLVGPEMIPDADKRSA